MKNLEVLEDLFGDQVSQLNENQLTKANEKLNKLLETRVDAKVKFQTEVIEADAKEKYDSQLKEATDKFDSKLKSIEEDVLEKAKSFKTKLKEAHKDVSKKIEEKKDKTVSEFKTTLVEKLDKYLKYELDKSIPQVYVESVAKVQVLEPIVEGFKKIMENNYIKFDEENFGLLKDARNEIIKIREELSETVKTNMNLNEDVQKFKRSMKISEVCEGLTDAQREKASNLLESYDVNEIGDRFSAIRDIIIEGVDKKDEDDIDEDEDNEKKVKKEGEETLDAKADKSIEVIENEKAETEEDTMNTLPESTQLNPNLADAEALSDDKRLIENWANEFRRLSN